MSSTEDKKLMWKLPKGGWKDYLTIAAAGEDYLLLEAAYKKVNYSYMTRDMYSFDLNTGTVAPILQEITQHKVPIVLGVYDNTAAVIQMTDAWTKARVMTFDLETAGYTEILKMDSSSGFENTYGALYDDTLYIMSGKSTMYSASVSGGKIEEVKPDMSLIPDLCDYYSIRTYDGKVYILMADSYNTSTALCEYDVEKNQLIPLVTTGEEMKARDFCIVGDTYYMWYGSRYVSGTLPE